MKRIPPTITFVLVTLVIFLVISISPGGSLAQSDESNLLSGSAHLGVNLPAVEATAPLAARELNPATIRELPQRQFQIPERESFDLDSLDADNCGQLLVNTKMDVIEFGDGTGTAEPWIVLNSTIYFFDDFSQSPKYSLAMADGDEGGGGDPDYDAFGQGFFMPNNLKSVRFEFSTASFDRHGADRAYVAFSLIDKDGNLLEDIAFFEIPQPGAELEWETWYFENFSKQDLNKMNGAIMALDFIFEGNRTAPSEIAFFDDATVTVCLGGSRLFLPSVLNKFGKAVGPVCSPPSEKPQDSIGAHRGYMDPGAWCNSNMSKTDTQDYYTININKSGKYKLQLTDLPKNTEWSAALILDQNPPAYAPGPTTGHCRIGTPGSSNKDVTCTLDKNKKYIVKVSAGATYDGPQGSYKMRVTGP